MLLKIPTLLLKDALDSAMALPVNHPNIKALKLSLALAPSSDFNPIANNGIPRFLHAFGDVMQLLKMTQAIDDVVDVTDPHLLADADYARDERGVCRFLHNKQYVPPDYIPALKRLDNKGVMEFGVGVEFSNLFCDYLHDRANEQIRLDKAYDSAERKTMAADSVNFAGLFGAFFFRLVQPPKTSLLDGVSHEAVKRAYPEIYEINRSFQMLDDLGDIMLDTEDEKINGFVSPNVVIAQAPKGVSHEFSEAVSQTSVSLSSLPQALKGAISVVQDQYSDSVSKIRSPLSRSLMESFWRTTIRNGFLMPSHPAAVKRQESNRRMIRSLEFSGSNH